MNEKQAAGLGRLGAKVLDAFLRAGKGVAHGAAAAKAGIKGMPDYFRTARQTAKARQAADVVGALRTDPEAMAQFRWARSAANVKANRLAELEHEFASAGRSRMPKEHLKEMRALRKEMRGGESGYIARSREKIVKNLTSNLEQRARGLSGPERVAAENHLRALRNLTPKLHDGGLEGASRLRRYGGKALAVADPFFIAQDAGEGVDNLREGNYGAAAMNFGRAALFMPFLRHFPGGYFNGLVRPFERARTMRGPVGMLARNSDNLLFADFAAQMAGVGPGNGPKIPNANEYEKITSDAKRAQGSGNWNDLTPDQRGNMIRDALEEYMKEYSGL